jgi:hypothetical protein
MQYSMGARNYGKAGITPRSLTGVGFLAPLRRKEETIRSTQKKQVCIKTVCF